MDASAFNTHVGQVQVTGQFLYDLFRVRSFSFCIGAGNRSIDVDIELRVLAVNRISLDQVVAVHGAKVNPAQDQLVEKYFVITGKAVTSPGGDGATIKLDPFVEQVQLEMTEGQVVPPTGK